AAGLVAADALDASPANGHLPAYVVYFVEIYLAGAVRPVAQPAARLKEAAKLGFVRALAPEAARGEATAESGIAVTTVGALSSLVADIAARGSRPRGGMPRSIRQDG